MPLRDPTINYYQQFCQLTIANMVMHQQIKKLLSERQNIMQNIMRNQLKKATDSASIKPSMNPADDDSSLSRPAGSSMAPPQLGSGFHYKQVMYTTITSLRLIFMMIEET